MRCVTKGLEDWILPLSFRGPGPFRLPHTELATAARDSIDVVALRLHVDDKGGDPPKIVTAELTTAQARNLAIRLWLAADE
jgi:hypothetical protein